jgi:hypothetical protein
LIERCQFTTFVNGQSQRENYRMSDEVLSANIRQNVEAQPTPVVEFVWQGVERNRSPASGTRCHATLSEAVLPG